MSDQKQEKGANDPINPTPPARVDRRLDPLAHIKPLFLEEYKKTESQTEAAKRVGVSPDTVSKWKRDKKFLAEFTKAHLEAVQQNNDQIKRTTMQLAAFGNPHYLIRNGQFVLDANGKKVLAYSEFYPQLNQFMLKNRLPEEFKDKFEHEITGQLVVQLASEFLAIIRKVVPAPLVPAIQKELEALSAKLVNQ